jgi:required for meiotic nuclear division protein 1
MAQAVPASHPGMVPPAGDKALQMRTRFVGSRLDLRAFESGKPLALHPLTIRAGERGLAVLFRFGAVALIDVSAVEEAAFFEALGPFVVGALPRPESEEVEIVVDPEVAGERVDENGVLRLRSAQLERLQVVAHVLAKSTVLAWYEQRATEIFDRVEALAEALQRGGRGPARGRELARQIGDVLLVQTRTVGRVEVGEKPEITWDDPDLDRLYEHLAAEYELRERDRALARKLELASHIVETYLNLLQNRQSLRVEWYIVILIVAEIAIVLYQIFLAK